MLEMRANTYSLKPCMYLRRRYDYGRVESGVGVVGGGGGLRDRLGNARLFAIVIVEFVKMSFIRITG